MPEEDIEQGVRAMLKDHLFRLEVTRYYDLDVRALQDLQDTKAVGLQLEVYAHGFLPFSCSERRIAPKSSYYGVLGLTSSGTLPKSCFKSTPGHHEGPGKRCGEHTTEHRHEIGILYPVVAVLVPKEMKRLRGVFWWLHQVRL